MIELIVATVVLVIGVLGLISAVTTAVRLVGLNRETTVAHEATRAMCERLQSAPFGQVFALYNVDPADDPDVAGSAPGASFAVAGLGVRSGDLDGAVGEILFPTAASLGLDLPAGVLTPETSPAGYTLVPVRVRLQWRGQNGDRSLALDNLLVEP